MLVARHGPLYNHGPLLRCHWSVSSILRIILMYRIAVIQKNFSFYKFRFLYFNLSEIISNLRNPIKIIPTNHNLNLFICLKFKLRYKYKKLRIKTCYLCFSKIKSFLDMRVKVKTKFFL